MLEHFSYKPIWDHILLLHDRHLFFFFFHKENVGSRLQFWIFLLCSQCCSFHKSKLAHFECHTYRKIVPFLLFYELWNWILEMRNATHHLKDVCPSDMLVWMLMLLKFKFWHVPFTQNINQCTCRTFYKDELNRCCTRPVWWGLCKHPTLTGISQSSLSVCRPFLYCSLKVCDQFKREVMRCSSAAGAVLGHAGLAPSGLLDPAALDTVRQAEEKRWISFQHYSC